MFSPVKNQTDMKTACRALNISAVSWLCNHETFNTSANWMRINFFRDIANRGLYYSSSPSFNTKKGVRRWKDRDGWQWNLKAWKVAAR